MEYPKALYLAGVLLLVQNAREEDAARADGFDDWHADHERTAAAGEPVEELVEASPGADAQHLVELEAELREREMHLQAKDDELTSREHAVAAREEAVAAAEAAAVVPTPADEHTDDQPHDRDTLKARAAELGIEYAPNIKTDKLAALVAAAQG